MVELTLFAVAFLAGVVVTVVALVVIGVGQEERDGTLRGAAPTRFAAAARLITGLHVRMPPPLTVKQQPTAGNPTARWPEAGSGQMVPCEVTERPAEATLEGARKGDAA